MSLEEEHLTRVVSMPEKQELDELKKIVRNTRDLQDLGKNTRTIKRDAEVLKFYSKKISDRLEDTRRAERTERLLEGIFKELKKLNKPKEEAEETE